MISDETFNTSYQKKLYTTQSNAFGNEIVFLEIRQHRYTSLQNPPRLNMSIMEPSHVV